MPEFAGAIVGALAIVGIPIFAWFSRRATQEGRLALRVERLGSVYALMPDSPEKAVFKSHLTAAIASLNSWLDPDNAKNRRIIRRVSVVLYVVCVIVVFSIVPFVDTVKTPWVTSVVGIVIGSAIAIVTFGTSYFVERSTRIKRMREADEQKDAAAATRMEALRQGERMPGPQPVKKRS